MAGIDDVLERLVTDDAFRTQLASDRDAALTGYELSDEDRALLESRISSDAGQAGTMEGRTSKAGLFGLLGGLDEIADAVSAGADDHAFSDPVTPSEPDAAQPYNPYVTVDYVETPPDASDASEYDYPGGYANRFDGVTPAADAKPTYHQVSLQNVAISHYDVAPDQHDDPGDYAGGGEPEVEASGDYQGDAVNRYHLEQAWPKAEADGHEAAHVVQQDGATPADADADADEKITIHGQYDEGSHAPADSDTGSSPSYQNTFQAIPDSAPAPAGDAGEQVYLSVKLENVQGPSDPTLDITADASVPAEPGQSNESDMDFASQRADDSQGEVAVEKVEFAYESIDLSPGETDVNDLSTDGTTAPAPAPTPGGVMHQDDWDTPVAGESHDGWIELNSVSQTVTPAMPEAPDGGSGVNEMSMDDTAGTEPSNEAASELTDAGGEATRPRASDA